MKLNITNKILLIAVIPFILFSSFFVYSSYTNTYENLMNEKKLSIQFVVQTAMTVISDFQDKVASGELSEKDAKVLAAKGVNKIRYGAGDYLWINDMGPTMISHPVKKLVGKDLSSFEDKVGDKIFVNMVNIAKEKGSGFIHYVWTDKKDKTKQVPKLSYIQQDKKWGWILGTGIYINDVNETIQSLLIASIIKVLVGMFVIIGCITLVVRKNIRGPLLSIAEKLYGSSQQVQNGASDSLSNCSSLESASQSQAASLQETVASVEEINAMISRNTASAEESKNTSLVSQESATDGKLKVDQMLSAMDDISMSNEKIVSRMKETNSEVSEILNIIKNINEKTKVINDIVFQTKLLSFNASVEAARAGETGKGFAVVAEEIGALANMSGTASDDIRELIDSSQIKVEKIVESTTNVMDQMIAEGSTAVDKGKTRAVDCKNVLDEIIKNVNLVNMKISEIVDASKEQSTGVNEISKAMELLDEVGHKNNTIVISTANSSKELQVEASELVNIVEEVKYLVEGKKVA